MGKQQKHDCQIRKNKIGWKKGQYKTAAEKAADSSLAGSTTNDAGASGEMECRKVKCSFEQDATLNDNLQGNGNVAAGGPHSNPAYGKQSAFTTDFTTPGVVLTHHHHEEHNRNHRCRHNLHTNTCTCFCHDRETRERQPGFLRTMTEIRSDYAGLDQDAYERAGAHRSQMGNKVHDMHEAFDENQLGTQKHDWNEPTLATTEYANQRVQTPHYNSRGSPA